MNVEVDRLLQKKWRPIPGLDGIWHAERENWRVPLRSVALRLADGHLAVYSPIRGLGGEAHRELTKIGQPAILIAPNHFHNLGLGEYAMAYSNAIIVASAVAAPRLKGKCKHEVRDETQLRNALASNISVLMPPGTKKGELWISVEASNGLAWIVGDAFFNIARTPHSAMGLLLRVLGISSGLRIGSTFRWLIRERVAYRYWLIDALVSQRPTITLSST